MLDQKTRSLAGVISALGFFAIVFQMPISVGNSVRDGASVAQGVWIYFAYFTIITNCLCAVVMAMVALGKVTSQRVLGAITTYVVVMMLVYWLLLSGERDLRGWPLFVDSILHFGVPLLTLAAWAIVFPKQDLGWRDGLVWVTYPVLYSFYIMTRGALEGWYPYFFLDVGTYGLGRVALNIVGLGIGFWLAGLALIAIVRLLNRKATPVIENS